MQSQRLDYPHDHDFLFSHQHRNERRTWIVIALTLATMVVEIVSGLAFGSMALLADGWHMASHAPALGGIDNPGSVNIEKESFFHLTLYKTISIGYDDL